MRAAEGRNLTNLVPTQGDATKLSYEDDSIDAVILTAVLGEIPDRAAALREIRRVPKPDGRLAVGELSGDPHSTSRASLDRLGPEAGLRLVDSSAPAFVYSARL